MKNLFVLLTSLTIISCGGGDNKSSSMPIGDQTEISIVFDEPDDPWAVGFADYPEGGEEFYELSSTISSLPQPLHDYQGLNIEGINYSDDLFMYAKHEISGLAGGQQYEAEITLTFATNAQKNCMGIGGSPGEDVQIKSGIVIVEPEASIADDGYYRMNIDKGSQGLAGRDASNMGDFSNSTECMSKEANYELKVVKTPSPIYFSSTQEGSAWIFVGTDSGHEHRTSIWYVSAQINIKSM